MLCEKYRQWLPLRDVRKEKCYFTPCIGVGVTLHLPLSSTCPNLTRSIETFDSETETFSFSPSISQAE